MVYIGSEVAINKDEWQDKVMTVCDLKHEDDRIREYFSCDKVFFLSSSTGCSCEFRIAVEREMGFGKPEAWFPESDDSIKGTLVLYDLVNDILGRCGALELLCVWPDRIGKPVESEDIRINDIERSSFRMFENRLLRIKSA